MPARWTFDLAVPEYAYLLGLLQTDGSLSESRGKGEVRLELSVWDVDLLTALQKVLPCYSSVRTRTRPTNFAASAASTRC